MSDSQADPLLDALRVFAETVTGKMSQLIGGEPEDQLRGPFEILLGKWAEVYGKALVCTGETPLPDQLGRPDYAIHIEKLLAGYAELKAPGKGADARRFRQHDRSQFKRFSAIPNLLYTDGNEWAVYRNGERLGAVVRMTGDVSTDGRKAVSPQDVPAWERLLRDFLNWQPLLPVNHQGQLELRGFAGLLAPLCRLLRDDVLDSLNSPQSPLAQLANDWRQLLFPDAGDTQFADAYAQTVTFALLLGRVEGAEPLTLHNAESALAVQHNLLSRALQVLTDPNVKQSMSASLDWLLRVIAIVPPSAFADAQNPWLYFYEDFLAVYDPALRKDAGAYYTPLPVVRVQVRLVDDLLANRLGKPLGFASPDVVTLDPSVGTGTYLLGVIDHALSRVRAQYGPGVVAGHATELAKSLYGFECMVGPYAVSDLRISRTLYDYGAKLPADGLHVYLTDTLENPHAEPPQLPLFLKPIAEQHSKALQVKSQTPVIVCMGNPPYDRHAAADNGNQARTGGWVRWGDFGNGDKAILRDFLQPALDAGHAVRVKNLYNQYVYFWRWALWKVFEHDTAQGLGVVSFITASSYLDGDAFCGMREHLRKLCDEIWIIDLGGEGRGTHKDDNVFAIQTPVAIAIALRTGQTDTERPAQVRYAKIEGKRTAKLNQLDAIDDFAGLAWQDCPDAWQAPFRPGGQGRYFDWPLLTDLLPWQHSGVQLKRTWPIAPDAATLERRWKALLATNQRATFFKETRDRKIHLDYPSLLEPEKKETAIEKLDINTRHPIIKRYAFRSFDRQWLFADNRLGDFLRPVLWHTHSDKQLYLSSIFTQPLDAGPALGICALPPDLHYFSGRGAKDIIPLYRDGEATQPNLLPGLIEQLAGLYQQAVAAEDVAAYLYGLLAHPAFAAHYREALQTRELRIPITVDASLFEQVRKLGARLIWLHTYGERFVPDGLKTGQMPQGAAKCLIAVADDDGLPEAFSYESGQAALRVGSGTFAPVSREVYEFSVSGLKVVQSWLKYRMRKTLGRKSSPLDDIRLDRWTSQFTIELLELLWVLEETVAGFPRQRELLERVIQGGCLSAAELPKVPDAMRNAPAMQIHGKLFAWEDSEDA